MLQSSQINWEFLFSGSKFICSFLFKLFESSTNSRFKDLSVWPCTCLISFSYVTSKFTICTRKVLIGKNYSGADLVGISNLANQMPLTDVINAKDLIQFWKKYWMRSILKTRFSHFILFSTKLVSKFSLCNFQLADTGIACNVHKIGYAYQSVTQIVRLHLSTWAFQGALRVVIQNVKKIVGFLKRTWVTPFGLCNSTVQYDKQIL